MLRTFLDYDLGPAARTLAHRAAAVTAAVYLAGLAAGTAVHRLNDALAAAARRVADWARPRVMGPSTLSQEQALAVALLLAQGEPPSEVAARLGLPLDAVLRLRY